MTDGAIDVAGGDLDAREFVAFYRESYRAVLVVAQALTGDLGRAADVTQEAFVAAQRRWGTISEYDRPDLWVRRVAINRAISLRRRMVNEVRALTRLSNRAAVSPRTEPDGSDVWQHVRRLPRAQAAVVVLVYIGDLTLEQAAAALGIATPTAKTHLRRAKRTLATWLGEEEDDDR